MVAYNVTAAPSSAERYMPSISSTTWAPSAPGEPFVSRPRQTSTRFSSRSGSCRSRPDATYEPGSSQ